MRWLGCCLLLAGCLRARATVVHPTDHERSRGDSGSTIARLAPASNDPTVDSKAFRPLKNTTKLLPKLQRTDLDRLRDDEPQQILQDLIMAAKAVAKFAGVKVS